MTSGFQIIYNLHMGREEAWILHNRAQTIRPRMNIRTSLAPRILDSLIVHHGSTVGEAS